MSDRYFIYRNITKSKDKHVYSMRSKDDNLVKGHASELFLTDAKLKVSDIGRKRVLSEGVKNVHAGIEGTLSKKKIKGPWVGITYNPKRDEGFIRRDTKEPVTHAEAIKLTADGAFIRGFQKTAGIF